MGEFIATRLETWYLCLCGRAGSETRGSRKRDETMRRAVWQPAYVRLGESGELAHRAQKLYTVFWQSPSLPEAMRNQPAEGRNGRVRRHLAPEGGLSSPAFRRGAAAGGSPWFRAMAFDGVALIRACKALGELIEDRGQAD